MNTIIDILTPDDIRILIESIDEDSRKGGFQRVFPTPSTHKYLRYFENQRYYNLFLDQWCQKFNRIEAKGNYCIALKMLFKKFYAKKSQLLLVFGLQSWVLSQAFLHGVVVKVSYAADRSNEVQLQYDQ